MENPLATQVLTGAVVDLLQRRLPSFPAQDAVLAAAGRNTACVYSTL